ncbi:MAG: cytochrome b/b6 domain-containing protein [Acidobacteria bacterium]|nr:cytochrome b/b6 domain-containing protein [Acidobacteriota bacterium]
MHSYSTRLGHWLAAIAIPVLALSGIQIFRAFPSFGEKLPPSLELHLPDVIPSLGGWLGGALSWHVTFAWFFAIAVLLQALDLARGGWRRVWLSAPEWAGVWPMIRHYFLRGPKPEVRELYNPLQKFAYLSMLGLEVVALATGFALLQPAWMGLRPFWSWQAVRLIHFTALAGFVSFLPGHLVMVIVAGRRPFLSMVTGEKQ